MCGQSNVERLKTTPISELNLDLYGRRLRRTIEHKGFDTLPELLNLSETEIDEQFDWNDAGRIIKLKNKYQENPEKLASVVLQKKEIDEEADRRTISKVETYRNETRKPHISTNTRARHQNYGITSLPSTPFTDALREFEDRAIEVFNDLDDRFQNVMVYQAFEEFSTDLGTLSDAFGQLFRHYSSEPRTALDLIADYLPNAFMLYVADRARSVYDGKNLWDNFFAGLDIRDDNVQKDFKQVFINQIERRKMPLYGRTEEANYYFYTALLHGGLSEDSWSNLWTKLLSLAQEAATGSYGFGGEMDGHSILEKLKDPEGSFVPKKTVLNILKKAPDSAIAPLFEASMRVAAQVVASENDGSYTMLSTFGLPEAAMEALRENQERPKSETAGARSSSSSTKCPQQSKRRLVYLPTASLQLDLAEGVVSIRWPRQQFPAHFSDARIDYYVNGENKRSTKFEFSVGKCVLDTVNIDVSPQARYDIELKLMQRDEKTNEYVETSSLSQTFSRNKPGCFEFIRDAKGLYRLRGRNERLTRKRRIAYIVKGGYKIEPGQGMDAVEEYETSGDWNDTRIVIYDVEPSSSGSIVNELTGEEVAVWQERYAAKIDKHHIIGETSSGVDLYGHIPNDLETNSGLPSVTIEALDGSSALDDLDITCICDGEKIAVPRKVMWEDDSGDSASAKIELALCESNRFDLHIEDCVLEAKQKSAGGKVVFRYRFSVVPIQDFKPSSIGFECGRGIADYGFQVIVPLDITRIQEKADTADAQEKTDSKNAWERYEARTLLKDEFLHLRIRSRESGKETDAKLALAAIDVIIPKKLANKSKEHPICLADALDLGPSAANFKIISYGWRYNRAALVMLGSKPLFFKNLKQPGEYGFNLFRHAGFFQQDDYGKPNRLSLNLFLLYGDDATEKQLAWTDVQMLDCAEGLGINSWKVLTNGSGKRVLRFNGKPICDIHFKFKRARSEECIGTSMARAGFAELILPPGVARRLDMQKEIIVEMSPSDFFGSPQEDYTAKLILKR